MCSLDHDLSLLDEAELSVDALVSDESLPALVSSPSTINAESRRLTSSLDNLDALNRSTSKGVLMQGQSQRSNLIPSSPHISTFGSIYDPVSSIQAPSKLDGTDNHGVDIHTKPHATKDSSPVAMLGSWPTSARGSILQEEDFPALGAPRTNETISTNTGLVTPKTMISKNISAMKRQNDKISEPVHDHRDIINADDIEPTRGGDAKSLSSIDPGFGASFISQPKEEAAKVEELAEASRFPPLPTPAISSGVATPSRSIPKTLRVVPSSIKTETRPASPSPLSISNVPAAGKPGHPHRPGTPASEMISDTASVTSFSVSISRAGSPPLSKVGTAPIRGTTKSQQRKQRKDVLKQETKTLAETPKTEEAEHAPVIGRKKKQKKEKPAKEVNAMPSAAIPTEALKDEKEPPSQDDGKPLADSNNEELKTNSRGYTNKDKQDTRNSAKEVNEATASSPTPSLPKAAEPADKTVERPQSSPSSVFADIRESLCTSAPEKLQLLKPVSSNSSRPEHNSLNQLSKRGDCKESTCKCGEMQDADLAALRAGRPVRKQFHTDGSRMLITPHGDCIRGLTPEEEDTFLALQTAIAATAENPAAFVAPRHQPSSGAFSLIKGRAVPNGRPNIFPSTMQPQSQDPIGKLQREDALSYINQYVLPRLSLGATSMGFPKGASSTRDSASLNSLAPYFYGPDAAAGVGIYSTPESARAIQDFAAPGMSLDEIGKGAAASSIGNIPLMSVEDAEAALTAAKRETEKLEKGLNLVIKRNRRLLLGA
ncbi:hypothetical protein THARTR1_10109 [Trichoderma harzianum]|uniref:General negative regulator of transcription subunit 4 n=1 Tax=Trichoderma harzianum TaxID=5544 RepID=A0A2K0TUG9_TRIHA|nr:hypothetical protein THARTR1_10109 [Trichoderma harzianum]